MHEHVASIKRLRDRNAVSGVNCRTVVKAIQAMTHFCCYGHDSEWESTVSSPWLDGRLPEIVGDLFENACLVHYRGRLRWSPACLRPSRDLTAQILDTYRIKVEDIRLNPSTIRQTSTRLACKHCSKMGKVLYVMGWEMAVCIRVDIGTVN